MALAGQKYQSPYACYAWPLQGKNTNHLMHATHGPPFGRAKTK